MVESSESILHILYHIHTYRYTYIYIFIHHIFFFPKPRSSSETELSRSRPADRQFVSGRWDSSHVFRIYQGSGPITAWCFLYTAHKFAISIGLFHPCDTHDSPFSDTDVAAPRVVSKLSGRPVVLPSAGASVLLDCIAFSLFDLIGFAVLPCFATLTSVPRALGLVRTCSDLRWGGFLSTLHYRTSTAVGKLPSFPRPARHSPRYFVVACCAISFVGDLLAAVECQRWTQSCELKAEICSGSKLSNFQETLVQ